MQTSVHVPTNLPDDERAKIAEANGIPLSMIGLARADDGSVIPAPPAPETAPALEDAPPAPIPAFDPAADAAQQAAFFDAHSSALAGGTADLIATDAELAAAAEATHGAPPAPAVLVGPVGTTPAASYAERPPCSLHDLVQTATQLLAAEVRASYREHNDPTGIQIAGGLLSADDAAINLALQAAAKLYTGAKKLTG